MSTTHKLMLLFYQLDNYFTLCRAELDTAKNEVETLKRKSTVNAMKVASVVKKIKTEVAYLGQTL